MKNRFRKFCLKVEIYFLRKRNPNATHVFWYSDKQYNIPDYINGGRKIEPLFKGQKYSEMTGFEYRCGMSNWDDAKIVGVGSTEDITNLSKVFRNNLY